MIKKIYSAGEIIIKEGKTDKKMFFILSGKVKPYKTINGERIDFPEIKEKDFFGEMSLFIDKPRTATIVAVTDTEVLEIEKNQFFEKLKVSPGFAHQMIKVLIQRLDKAHEIIMKLEGIRKSVEILYGKNNFS